MSELSTLARPYAEAVFKIAKQHNSASKWSGMLAFLTAVVNDPAMIPIIANPKISHAELTSLMLDICQEQLDEQGVNFVKLLIENNRLNLTPFIKEHYEVYKADDEGYIDVEVFTAYKLPKEELNGFESTLKKMLAKNVRMSSTIDKSIIGGFLAKAGDKVIDGSIKGQLQLLAKKL